MSAAAARAALVAMQNKKKKKAEMIKNLMAKSNLTEDNREYLYKALLTNNDTKFIANISRGKPIEARQSLDENAFRKMQSTVDEEFEKPAHISQRHFDYVKRIFTRDTLVRDKWMDAYVSQSSDFFNPFSYARPSINSRISPSLTSDGQESLDKSDGRVVSSHHRKESIKYHTINEVILFNQIVRSNKWFNTTIVFSILAAGVLVGIQSYPEMNSGTLDAADILVQVIFSFECMFKILAEGRHPLRYWTGAEWRWNNFDFWLVVLCWFPAGGNVAFLRLLRLMRLLKLVSKVKQLQVIVMGLAKGLSAVSYIILLMLLIFYLFAVMGVVSFRRNDPYHFGSLGVSMLSLFRAATLEDWADIMYINWFGCDSGYSGVLGFYDVQEKGSDDQIVKSSAGDFPGLVCDQPKAQPLLSAIFFISFVLVAAFVTMALFVGAVCGGMYEALDDFKEMEEEEKRKKEEQEAEDEENNVFGIKAFRRAFEAVDTDCSELIDEEELLHAMKMLGVEATVETVREIMAEVDIDKNGGLDFEEFVSVMTNGKGMASSEGAGADTEASNSGLGSTASLQEKRSPREKFAQSQSISKNSFSQKVGLKVANEDHAKSHSMYLASHIRRAWRGEESKQQFQIKATDPKWKQLYFIGAGHADTISANETFINMITLTILAAGVVVGIQIEMDSSTIMLDVLDAIILAIFTIEVVVKVMAEGDEPQRYFYDNWNCFDFFIVFACFIFILPFMPDVGSMLAMLRLLRLLRVLKLVKALPQLRIITIALISGFGSITFVTIMLFLLFYLFANIAIIFFGENDPMHFGNLQMALTSLFVIATLDDWTDIMYTNMLGCDVYGYDFGSADLGFDEKSKDSILNCTKPTAFGWYAAMLIVVFVVMSSFVLLNVFIGLVAIAMEESKLKQKNEAKVAEKLAVRMQQLDVSKKEVKLYQQVFDELDQKKDGQLDTHDFKALIRCLPMLRFATALMEDGPDIGRASNKFDTFKVMNKKDIKYLMLLINPEYSGIIEMPDFLVLMDFMRRVDKSPLILHSFRESVENAIEDHDKTVEILPTIFDNEPMTDGQLSRSSNGSMDPASFAEPDSPPPMVRRRSQFIKIDEYHRVTSKMQSEINDKDVINDGIKQELNRLKSELEKAKKHMKKLEEVHGIVKAVPSPGSSVRRIFQDVKSSSVESNQPTWVAKKTAPQQRSSLEARFRRFSQDYSDDNFVGVSGSSGTGEYTSGGVTIDNDRVDTIESMCDDSDASSSTSTAGDRQTTPNPNPTSSQISNRLSVGSGYKTAQVSDTTSSMDESQRLRSASRSGSDTAAISRLDEPDSASSNASTLPPLDMSEGGSSVGEPSPYRTTPSLRANHTQSLSEFESMDPPTDTPTDTL